MPGKAYKLLKECNDPKVKRELEIILEQALRSSKAVDEIQEAHINNDDSNLIDYFKAG
jgi:hypothetical protein